MKGVVRFQILGPLTVTRDGKPQPPQGRIAPRLLAILLLAAGRPVSMERLITGVWEDDPPATARRQVQNTCASLRRRYGGEVIAAAGDGYRIDLDHCELDVADFGVATAAALQQAEAGDTVAAVRSLRSALALWSGRPLSGLSGRVIDAAVTRLVEAHMATVEDLSEYELSLGEAMTSTDALREQLRENPYRQRSAARLMRTLHHGGRTTEALTVFKNMQARLAEDLGLDPDAELRQLHATLLRGDTSAASGRGSDTPGAADSPAGQRATVPAQLPAAPTVFVGRTQPLAALGELHDDPHAARACVISGAAGTGKTALAIHWGHAVRQRFPDGQIYLNLRGFGPEEPMSELEAVRRCVRALQPEGLGVPTDRDEAVNLFHTLVGRKRVLLVFDNARDAEHVRALLPNAPAFAVITSRNRQEALTATDAAVEIELEPLANAESIDLLSEVVSAGRLSADVVSAHDIAERCGHLPLALRIAAAHLAVNPDLPIVDYAAQLARHDRLDSLVIEGDPGAAVAVSLDHSFRALDAEARQLVCRLGVVPGEDFSESMLAAVVAPLDVGLEPVLRRLVTSHVLEQHRAGRYRFHDLVREYAAKQAERFVSEEERGAIRERFIEWHFPRSSEYDPAEDVNIIMAGQELSEHPKLWRLVSPLVRAINAGNHDERIPVLIEAGIANAKSHGDRLGECLTLSLLGTFMFATERFDDSAAIAYRALELADHLDDRTLGTVKNSLGVRLQALGRSEQAERQYLEALRVVSAPANDSRLFTYRMNLCNLYIELGRYDEARELHALACRTHQARDGVRFQYRSRDIESRIAVHTGEYAVAAPIVDDMVEVAMSSKNQSYVCGAWLRRGELTRLMEQYDSSFHDLTRALESAYALQRAGSECTVITELALLESERGRHESALEFAAMLSMPRYGSISLSSSRASIEQALCTVKLGIGAYRESISYGERAASRFASMPRPLFQARTLATVAEAHSQLGDRDKAADLRGEASAIFSHIGVRSFGLPESLTHELSTEKRS